MRLVAWIKAGQSAKTVCPTRVLISADGEAVPYHEAVKPRGMGGKGMPVPDIIFIREDGWSLGATKALAKAAFHLWEGHWVFFITKEKHELQPISELSL